MKISKIKAKVNLPFIQAAIQFLEDLPNDEVIDLTDLSMGMGREKPTKSLDKLQEYRCYVFVDTQHKFVYGNKRAIAKLKKQLKKP